MNNGQQFDSQQARTAINELPKFMAPMLARLGTLFYLNYKWLAQRLETLQGDLRDFGNV